MLVSLLLPYWKVQIKAPQYPEGLKLIVYADRVEGDVAEIDGLNHYIGMRPLGEAAPFERKISIPGVSLLSLVLFALAFLPRRRFLIFLLPVIAYPIIFPVDLYFWMRHFGLNLDPRAPFSSAIKPFVPPILGPGKIAQFDVVASFLVGYYLSLISAFFSLVVLYLRGCGRSKKSSSGIVASMILFFVLLSSSVCAETFVVGADQKHSSIQSVLKEVSDGDVVHVEKGIYQGPFVIDKSIQLIGKSLPVIEGTQKGNVLEITAPNVVLRGFVIRGSGKSLSSEDSGVVVKAPKALIENNVIEDVLFGVYVRRGPSTVIRKNQFKGKDLDIPRRGDLIRIWYSDHTVVEENLVYDGRDAVLWFSNHLTVTGNEFRRGRYGLHFMYCSDASVKNNLFSDNSVGAYLMYSSDVILDHNKVINNHGSIGYGIGLKDMERARIENNLLADNLTALFLDNSIAQFKGNLIAYNNIGVRLLPSAQHNQFYANSFVHNGNQVMIAGMGRRTANLWQGNYWSDYRGYDANQDGVGDTPYQAVKLFERLADRFSALKLYSTSLCAQALDFASMLFPIFTPQPLFQDAVPSTEFFLPEFKVEKTELSWPWVGFSSLLICLPVGFMLGLRVIEKESFVKKAAPLKVSSEKKELVLIKRLTKKYGSFEAIKNFDLEINEGETLVLWGSNGAGKTTLIRCLLGILSFEGKISVQQTDVATQAKEVRKIMGYIPQEIRLHQDLTILETVRFYARLRHVSFKKAEQLLAEWQLKEVSKKRVSSLSGGMKQKLALVIALLSDPKILLMDEATSNLDINARREFLVLLDKLKAMGKTLVFCSHRSIEIWGVADKVVILDKGKKVAEGTPEEVKEYLGEQVLLTITVPANACAKAVKLIQNKGFQLEHNETQLWIHVPVDQKVEPIRLLVKGSIPIVDFELEEKKNEERSLDHESV